MSLPRRQLLWIAFIAAASFGAALCLRYLVVENPRTQEFCQLGAAGLGCMALRLLIALFQYSVFGWIALIAAALNLFRPSLLVFSIALAATSFGLIMYNAGLAAFGLPLLLLTPARLSRGTASLPRQ
jgi:hypothetical protein